MSAISHFKLVDSITEANECHTAHFSSRGLEPGTTIVAASGEIDAANALEFVAYALRDGDHIERLVVDLTGVEFFGTAGFSALHTLNVRTAGADIYWAMTPSASVKRLLRICDPDGALPVFDSVEQAVQAVRARPAPLLKLVP
ncbi:STAS domain-containing protein [Mycolicibacterium flavescens]|uniref:Anti-anti-sigma factor n=1 Tax=Mycolicibacterium flavescens TaxID=1776 RepID=A0A1E3RH19_MYCFV|nr:STAS domain-containing protein [Mycolicibacterium flavescens]MCV7283117.1 STAS domain-containing protein [Mycolicibacterium flavescens]ODQ89160.1 anti-anti-sigma factor [Mycolicibacterium flavescens]